MRIKATRAEFGRAAALLLNTDDHRAQSIGLDIDETLGHPTYPDATSGYNCSETDGALVAGALARVRSAPQGSEAAPGVAGAGVAIEAARSLTQTALDCLGDIERALEQMAVMATCMDSAFGSAIAGHERLRQAMREMACSASLICAGLADPKERAREIMDTAYRALGEPPVTPKETADANL